MNETTTEVINEHLKIDDYDLHITGTWNDVEVWLNTPVADFDGLCIGGGQSKRLAVAEAIRTLERALQVLRERG